VSACPRDTKRANSTCRRGGIASISAGFEHPGHVRSSRGANPESSARMGVVYGHCSATAMLCHTTSQLTTAESILDLLSPWRVWRGYVNRMLRSTNERDSTSGRDNIGWASGSFL